MYIYIYIYIYVYIEQNSCMYISIYVWYDVDVYIFLLSFFINSYIVHAARLQETKSFQAIPPVGPVLDKSKGELCGNAKFSPRAPVEKSLERKRAIGTTFCTGATFSPLRRRLGGGGWGSEWVETLCCKKVNYAYLLILFFTSAYPTIFSTNN